MTVMRLSGGSGAGVDRVEVPNRGDLAGCVRAVRILGQRGEPAHRTGLFERGGPRRSSSRRTASFVISLSCWVTSTFRP
jgi:hypothetical protein